MVLTSHLPDEWQQVMMRGAVALGVMLAVGAFVWAALRTKGESLDWRVATVVIVIGSQLSAKVAHLVTERRMDALLKREHMSMEREARIWLDWIEAVESGEFPALQWLYGIGAGVVGTYQRQAARDPSAQNPALQQRIQDYREHRKPAEVAGAFKKLALVSLLPSGRLTMTWQTGVPGSTRTEPCRNQASRTLSCKAYSLT